MAKIKTVFGTKCPTKHLGRKKKKTKNKTKKTRKNKGLSKLAKLVHVGLFQGVYI